MSQNKYWQSFGELKDAENFQQKNADEFRGQLPFEDIEDSLLGAAKPPRRDFLKYLGFSTAAAAIAAGCKTPVNKAIPFANKPENIIPGEATYYATTYVQDGDVVPILAKVRDGRPIKIEGNESFAFSKGGTTARVQASVLDLYDTNRITQAKEKKGDTYKDINTFEQLDDTIAKSMANSGKTAVALITSTITSPTSKTIIEGFLQKYPGSVHVQYDDYSYAGMLMANETCFGKNLIPTYDFEKASKVVVSIGADFLGTWLSPVEFQNGYSVNRKIDEHNPQMSKHYQFESFLSMTGANADERFACRASETGVVALALYAALGGGIAAPAISDAKLKAGIEKVAADLKANTGKALVVSGSNDVNEQIIVNAINQLIGANGTTINWALPSLTRQGSDKGLAAVISSMESGVFGAVIICDVNPAYSWAQADKFISAMKKVPVTISFNPKLDETSVLCKYLVPSHHYLESWGDAEAKPGHYSFIQPTIYPLFKTRAWQDSLLKWSGNSTTYEAGLKTYWVGKLGGEQAWFNALEKGIIESAPVAAGGGSFNSGGVSGAVAAITSAGVGKGKEIALYQNISTGSGSQAGNAWLLELPDPVSKACWGNYALISFKLAEELGIKLNNDYEYYPDKPVVKIELGGKSIELPILVTPGMHPDTVAVAIGYGRNPELGKAVEGVGQKVSHFASFNGVNTKYHASGATVTNTGTKKKIAQMQIHNSYEGRVEVVRETTLGAFKKTPNEILDFRNKLVADYAPIEGNYRKEATLYGDYQADGLKWGMTIDMNACYGCGACVVACHAENNVPVVGNREVLRYHDMHWLRIDRYFVSDEKNPDDLKGVVFQPMLCQHCDNAPCENVCPVAATNHSNEGINQMAYNRCIGTRYCANNCPYKVRRFNWADYTGADSFENNQNQKIVGRLDDVVLQMNDELTRMVLNPDVTVRSRGVMEKCSFCIQRTQAAKLTAKKENRPFADGDVKTACQQACAAGAITFGNVKDKNAAVSKARLDNPQRSYYVLEQLHVLPNITYLAKVRNTEEIPVKKGGHHEEAAGAHDAPHAAEGTGHKEKAAEAHH